MVNFPFVAIIDRALRSQHSLWHSSLAHRPDLLLAKRWVEQVRADRVTAEQVEDEAQAVGQVGPIVGAAAARAVGGQVMLLQEGDQLGVGKLPKRFGKTAR